MTDLSGIAHAAPNARVIGPEELEQTAVDSLLAPSPAEVLFSAPDSTHVVLPTGLLHEGSLITNAEVRELTGADEEAFARAARGKQLNNPAYFLDLILQNAVTRLGEQIPTPEMLRRLLTGDRAFLGLAIRRLTYGPEWEIESFVCRLCGEKFGVAVDLSCPGDDIKVRTIANPLEQFVEVKLQKGLARVRLVSGADEIDSIRDGTLTVPEQTSIFIDRCVLSVAGVHPPPKFAQSLGLKDRRAIIKALGEVAPGPLLGEVSVPCSKCGKSADYSLNMADLFLG